MTGRPSVGLADLEEVARRIAEGRLSNRPECTLEVSTYVWNRNSFEAQERFEDTCAEHGVRFAVVERIGGIEWACPYGRETFSPSGPNRRSRRSSSTAKVERMLSISSSSAASRDSSDRTRISAALARF
jgi:hypothetical protein